MRHLWDAVSQDSQKTGLAAVAGTPVEAKEGPTLLGTADMHGVAAPSPRPETRNGWKAGGPINSDALFIGEVQSFLAQRSW